jgi:hypothetical protein
MNTYPFSILLIAISSAMGTSFSLLQKHTSMLAVPFHLLLVQAGDQGFKRDIGF